MTWSSKEAKATSLKSIILTNRRQSWRGHLKSQEPNQLWNTTKETKCRCSIQT